MFSLQSNNETQRSADELSQKLRAEIEKYTEMNAELRKKHKEADDIIKEAHKLLSKMQRQAMAFGGDDE